MDSSPSSSGRPSSPPPLPRVWQSFLRSVVDSSASTSGTPSTPLLHDQESALQLGFGILSSRTNPSIDDRVALLLRAAYEGYTPKIRKLVEQLERYSGMSVSEAVASVQAPWSKRHGPLHMASSAGKYKACRFLIEELGLDVNATGTDGATPLVLAIFGSGSVAVVNLLLDYHAYINRSDSNGCTPLHIATIRGRSPLFVAAEHGNAKIVNLLLDHEAFPHNLVYSPLKAAIFAHSMTTMESLLKTDARLDMGFPETPLIAAATAGLTDFIKCLLEAGADANILDDNGRTAVEIAAIHGWQECVEILFPVTTRLATVADWSTHGIIQHAKLLSSEPQDHVLHEDDEIGFEAEGDSMFCIRDYSHALTLYTMAMEIDPDNSTLYAKRSLCFLHLGYGEDMALEDANTYRDMQSDLSNSSYKEGGGALILVKVFGIACEELISGWNLDFAI